jgi:hypothetical protein
MGNTKGHYPVIGVVFMAVCIGAWTLMTRHLGREKRVEALSRQGVEEKKAASAAGIETKKAGSQGQGAAEETGRLSSQVGALRNQVKILSGLVEILEAQTPAPPPTATPAITPEALSLP